MKHLFITLVKKEILHMQPKSRGLSFGVSMDYPDQTAILPDLWFHIPLSYLPLYQKILAVYGSLTLYICCTALSSKALAWIS
ncbi:MAG: hypothetical protein WCP19_15725 [Chloroflexota bacterium]